MVYISSTSRILLTVKSTMRLLILPAQCSAQQQYGSTTDRCVRLALKEGPVVSSRNSRTNGRTGLRSQASRSENLDKVAMRRHAEPEGPCKIS